MIGELDYEGSLKIGHNVKIGYFAQNQDELLNGEKTVFETIDDIAKGDIRSKMRICLPLFFSAARKSIKKSRSFWRRKVTACAG